MLPVIAELFDTSIDHLMGYARECSTAEREAFFKKVNTLSRSEKIAHYREMLQQYPNDTILQFGLANLLYGLMKKQKNAGTEQEIHFLCNRILHSNRPDMQCGAKRILAFLSAQNGNMEEAMKYVNELPSIYCGREIVAEQILNGISFGEALKKWEAQMGD